MIREPLRHRGRQHQGVTRLAETERPGRTVVTVSEQVTDDNGHSALAVELARLRAENARLLRLLNLTRQEAAPPGPWQSGLFEAPPGLVHADSPPEAKVAPGEFRHRPLRGADQALAGPRGLINETASRIEAQVKASSRVLAPHTSRRRVAIRGEPRTGSAAPPSGGLPRPRRRRDCPSPRIRGARGRTPRCG